MVDVLLDTPAKSGSLSFPLERTSADSLKKMSLLDSLPGELIQLVFDQVWPSDGPQLLHPISRALRPLFERNLYSNIDFDSYFVPEDHAGPSQDFQFEQEDPVYDFFKFKTSLESFDLRGSCSMLQERMLSAKYAYGCFKALRSLSTGFHTFAMMPHPDETLYVDDLPNLKRLHVDIRNQKRTEVTEEEGEMYSKWDEAAELAVGESIGCALSIIS